MTSIKTKIRGMDVEITEEGIVFTGMMLDDPSNVLRDAIAEIERLRSALQFYADDSTYITTDYIPPITADSGEVARQTLEECP